MVTYGLPGYELPLLGLLGTFGPGIAAFIAAGVFEGRAGIRDLVRRISIWRVGAQWYVVALFLRLLLSLAALYGYGLLTGQALPLAVPAWSVLVVTVLVQVPNTLLEEIGWRGYAYPRLLPGRNPVVMSLLLGAFWTVWHLPYWLTAPVTQKFGIPFLALAALIVLSLSVVITWLWLNTRGSVLLAWLFHLATNTTTAFVVLSPEATGGLGPMALEVGLMVAVATGAAWLMARPAVRSLRPEVRPLGS
jgi:membrane protease YdiL (CAAX protease family)